jgi:cytochrome c oxidase subunit I
MARRYADYLPTDEFTLLNTVSTVGSFILGCSTLFFIWNVWKSWRFGPLVTVDDPWGFGNSLEWAPQTAADELRPDRGPHRSDEAVSSSGARDIDVPAPEDVHRDDRPAAGVGGDPLGPDEGDRPADPRWRTGGQEHDR